MGRRDKAREEARFARGEVGVDGQAVEEEVDPLQKEQGEAREQLFRSRTWLGREFLTWLLWRSEQGGELVRLGEHTVQVLFVDRLVLRGIKGEVAELSLKGKLAPYSEECKHALQRGLLVHGARLRLSLGEREFEATVDAECLDIRSAKLPQLLTEEEDDRRAERLDLTEQLSQMVDSLVEDFLAVRVRPAWRDKTVPQMQKWMRGEEATGGVERTLARSRRLKAAS